MSDEEAEPYIRDAVQARKKALEAQKAADLALEEADRLTALAMNKGASPTTLAKRLGVHRTRVYQVKRAAKK